jgi:ADP-heptose:LPS heptosyltransferase
MIDMVGSGYYGVTLAAASGIGGVNLRPVEFTNIKASEGGGVIVCPFPLHSTLQLPITIWQPVIRHLRSYGMRVRIMGEAGDRMDACSFTEAETLSNLSVRKKLEAIASADLVVGVPCAWMWTTTSWDKKMLVFYPDGIPMERWFPKVEHSAGSNQRWMLYQAWNLQVPIMLSGMKQLLGTL